MARIPTISGTAVPSSPLGIKADAGAAMAGARANSQFAGALQQTAQVMAGIVAQRQAHIDRGLLAKEDSIRRKTAAEIQTYMDNNQGTPEAWQKFHDDTWKAYDDGRNARAKGWSPQLKSIDDIQTEEFRTESGIRFSTQQNKALIAQANARLEANGDMKLMDGDVNGALQSYGAMNLTPDRKLAKIQQATDKAEFNRYATQLSDATDINVPAAKSLDELKRIEAELKAKNKGGEYQYGKIANEKGEIIGGLMEENRIQLLNRLREMKNAQIVAMSQAGRELVRKAKEGMDPSLIFNEALKAGQIDEATARIFVPEVDIILKKRAEESALKAQAEADRLAAKRDAAEARTRAQINQKMGATITAQDIERRAALGVTRPNDPNALTPEAAERLRAELMGIESADMGDVDYTDIEDKLNDRLGYSIFGWSFGKQSSFSTFFRDKSQMDDAERAKFIDDIHAARISKGAKLRLLDKFFEVQKWDLREGEVTDKEGDRDISPEEKELRASVIDSYRQLKTAMSPRAIGARYMDDINRIGDWFRSNANATPAQRQQAAKKFYDEITRGVSQDAANSLISEIYE